MTLLDDYLLKVYGPASYWFDLPVAAGNAGKITPRKNLHFEQAGPQLLRQWRALTIPHVGILLEVSVGELIDRMTILEIKAVQLRPILRRAARRELRFLRAAKKRQVEDVKGLEELVSELRSINRALWDVEEALREF